VVETVMTGKFITEHLSEVLTTSVSCLAESFPARPSTSSDRSTQQHTR